MSSYKNPFAEYNSNIMSSEQISEFFAEPFDFFDINATDIVNEKSSLIFVGGRGTGKTMLLRQFSYNVQRVSLPDRTSFIEKVRNDSFIGVYFRVDNPLLRCLETLSTLSSEPGFAESVFTHFFELTIFKDYLEVVRILLSDSRIEKGCNDYKLVIADIKRLLDCTEVRAMTDIDELLEFVVGQINYVWKYQSEKAIDIADIVRFTPSCGVFLQGRLTNEFLKTSVLRTLQLEKVSILLLIDEFENFPESSQRVINTAMRFTKDYGAKFRIGMRPNGFWTVGTLDDMDFVKEGRDYRKVEFGFSSIKKGNNTLYTNLVKTIADKRLSAVSHFKDKCIVEILGESEDLESEAKEIVKGKSRHIEVYLKLINEMNGTKMTLDDLLCLRHENPLFEMENLRLLLSGKSLEYVSKAFKNYLCKEESEESKKFCNDYDKKYKLSFVFILCSIYHIEKKGYYSFSDYCHLSSGIIGGFIELCRRAFEIAYFREREFLLRGNIAKRIQTDAAYEYAEAERDMIPRIAKFGGRLSTFIDNIGNVFGHIHRDVYMRYPETNLFPVNIGSLKQENEELIGIACRWSLLIKKPNAQDTKAKSKKQDIYYLNRIYAPIFKFSYRTRGGLNPIIVDDSYFENTFNPQSVLPAKRRKGSGHDNSSQMAIYPFIDVNVEDNNTSNG